MVEWLEQLSYGAESHVKREFESWLHMQQLENSFNPAVNGYHKSFKYLDMYV